MCILIYDERNNQKLLDKDIFKRSQEKNPHGMGIMYALKGKLHIWKTLEDFQGLWQRYLFARKRQCKVAIHFRKATEGTVTEDNLHPFEIAPGFAFMHNGTVKDIKDCVPKGSSDTRHINEELFSQFPGDFLQSPIHRVMIDNLIDAGRMLFMDNTGACTIINEGRWGAKWVDGVWYSKGEHLPYYLDNNKIPWVGSYTGWQSSLWGGDGEDNLYDPKDVYDGTAATKETVFTKIEIADVSTVKRIIPFKPTKKEHPFQIGLYQQKESRKVKKARRKMEVQKALNEGVSRVPAIMGPMVNSHNNLIFDYGYMARSGFYDSRIKEVQDASLNDHQLWAIGDGGDEMPVILPMSGVTMHGTLYKITKDYLSVVEDIDQMHGCDHKNPDISVFHRRFVKIHINVGTVAATTVWAWTYRFAMSLNDIDAASIVPFGDWSRWCTKVHDYPISPIQAKKELLS